MFIYVYALKAIEANIFPNYNLWNLTSELYWTEHLTQIFDSRLMNLTLYQKRQHFLQYEMHYGNLWKFMENPNATDCHGELKMLHYHQCGSSEMAAEWGSNVNPLKTHLSINTVDAIMCWDGKLLNIFIQVVYRSVNMRYWYFISIWGNFLLLHFIYMIISVTLEILILSFIFFPSYVLPSFFFHSFLPSFTPSFSPFLHPVWA